MALALAADLTLVDGIDAFTDMTMRMLARITEWVKFKTRHIY
jgi:hypothetical protein